MLARRLIHILLITTYHASAQLPPTMEVRLVLGDAMTPDGTHQISVRWYSSPVGGISVAGEDLEVDLVNGSCTVLFGRTSPLPLTLLRSGAAQIGVSVDGGQERSPRTELIPSAFSHLAAIAEVARSLAPEATGLVSSINEMAGAINLVADPGVRITRDGNLLRIGRAEAVVERGTLTGNGRAFLFVVTPLVQVGDAGDVTYRVIAGTTTISASITLDKGSNTLVFVTSATLLPTETLEWEIRR